MVHWALLRAGDDSPFRRFAVHIDAFRASLSRKDLDALHAVLDPLDKSDSDFVHKLAIAGQKCRDIVYKAELTPEHTERILEAYRKLTAEYEDSSTPIRPSPPAVVHSLIACVQAALAYRLPYDRQPLLRICPAPRSLGSMTRI